MWDITQKRRRFKYSGGGHNTHYKRWWHTSRMRPWVLLALLSVPAAVAGRVKLVIRGETFRVNSRQGGRETGLAGYADQKRATRSQVEYLIEPLVRDMGYQALLKAKKKLAAATQASVGKGVSAAHEAAAKAQVAAAQAARDAEAAQFARLFDLETQLAAAVAREAAMPDQVKAQNESLRLRAERDAERARWP